MEKIDRAIVGFDEMNQLAKGQSPIHKLHPLAKLITTIAYIFVTVSFNKYDFTGMFIMVLYPILLFEISGISVKTCFYRLRMVIPLVVAVGIFNPFFDKSYAFALGDFVVTGGMISFITLLLKGIFCLMASFIFVATTSIDAICMALRKFHVPSMIVTLLLLTFRYIWVMLDEVSVMTTAYKLRAPYQKGIHISAWGSFLGQLLLRSMDRAEELYNSMLLRGFKGEFYYADVEGAEPWDYLYTTLSLILFMLFRYINVASLAGNIIIGG